MNIHEYQAKELMQAFGVATPSGKVASTPEEAKRIALELATDQLVIKAQIHAGGRGKGVFKSGFKGGVHLCKTPADVREKAAAMLGQVLVTHQTGPEGRLVSKVLVAKSEEIECELYFAITLDRALGQAVIIASVHGGVDIEEVAHKHPEAIVRERIHPTIGFQPYQARKLALRLGFRSAQMRDACKLFHAAWKLFVECDCSLLEINPLVLTRSGAVMALDAKFNFDDNALFRQEKIAAMRDTAEEDPREVEASKYHLNYIGLDGEIGCMVNGAGLAMATMDIIQHYGGRPANFLDVGGGANEDQVSAAFKILISDDSVKAILVNIFGGIMRCDVIAQGIIHALRSLSLGETGKRAVPLVVRLEGTNVELGKKLLRESELALIAADSLADGAKKAVAAARESK